MSAASEYRPLLHWKELPYIICHNNRFQQVEGYIRPARSKGAILTAEDAGNLQCELLLIRGCNLMPIKLQLRFLKPVDPGVLLVTWGSGATMINTPLMYISRANNGWSCLLQIALLHEGSTSYPLHFHITDVWYIYYDWLIYWWRRV